MIEYVRALPFALLIAVPGAIEAQILDRPTPAPAVTAESEEWYVSRAPLVVGGTLYYPAGPQVHFNANEMVPTGFCGAVPVYTKTTIEPRSVIFVPLRGGLMQPYERRRSGELAGTEGSTAPSFPVEPAVQTSSMGNDLRIAVPPRYVPPRPAAPTSVVGTSGVAAAPPLRPFASATKPAGLNALFIDFDGQRWFNSGQAIPFDSSRLIRTGTHAGFPVYSDASRPGTVYIPVTAAAGALVVPYSNDRGR